MRDLSLTKHATVTSILCYALPVWFTAVTYTRTQVAREHCSYKCCTVKQSIPLADLCQQLRPAVASNRMNSPLSQIFLSQWWFYVGDRGEQAPRILPSPPLQINTGQLNTVVLLLVNVIGSIVISLSRCCLPNDKGPGPPNIFS